MPLTYLDSSALVKRYVSEVGSAWVAGLCAAEPVAFSLIAVPELASAMARRALQGRLSDQQRDILFRLFLSDTLSSVVVELGQAIAEQAATLRLTAPQPVRLRTLDALHVASAKWVFARARRHGIATGSFVTADRVLGKAALWAGLSTLNPEDYP